MKMEEDRVQRAGRTQDGLRGAGGGLLTKVAAATYHEQKY
jgi:hypothetical protein